MTLLFRDDRHYRALTGLGEQKLDELEKAFAQVYHQRRQAAYEQGKAKGQRQRRPGGGRKGALPTIGDKLVFLLYYLKVYPTFDVLATQFGMARSKACENVHKLVPLLHQTLVQLGVLPKREFTTVEEFRGTFSGIDLILIDATERAYRRHLDPSEQREKYSGKKKGIPSKTPL